ncbi:MAG: hypothetical protein ACI8UD_000377 [Planctomycetota bacterium]|jgi:hypothetical protein
MSETLRLIRLVVLARVRSAGWVPWLLVAGWLVIAAFQEPLMFRGYGIYLVDDAAATGGLVVLLILLLAERRSPRRYAATANLSLVGAMAILQAVGGYIADQSQVATPFSVRAAGAGSFFLAWAPLSLTLARKLNGGLTCRTVHMILVLTAGLMGSMLAVALRTSPDVYVLTASALAIVGAACWASDRLINS